MGLGRHILCLLALAVPLAVAGGLWHPHRPRWHDALLGPDEVDLATARSWPQALWCDARDPSAFAAGHVPGALSLTESGWDDDFAQVVQHWSPERPIVVYCSSSSCDASTAVAARLRHDLGSGQVWVLHGGWEAVQAGDTP